MKNYKVREMEVYKFGGASVKDALGVQCLVERVKSLEETPAIIVVSAMGKNTNALEQVVSWVKEGKLTEALEKIQEIVGHTSDVWTSLGLAPELWDKVMEPEIWSLKNGLENWSKLEFDACYDAIVAYGELLSTRLVHAALEDQGQQVSWWDARRLIHTDSNFRQGEVDWVNSQIAIERKWRDEPNEWVVTQGFIAGDPFNQTTTLGREGSDFSAAIFGYCLGAEKVTIWKDVPGLMTADPKRFPDASLLEKVDYLEAIELSYYGASVIHPKTLNPLRKKGIPLHVRSFLQPDTPASVIAELEESQTPVVSTIVKENQVLLTLTPSDFSILSDRKMGELLLALDRHHLKANLLDVSALNFSVCMDLDNFRLGKFMQELSGSYRIKYNLDLELHTLRHYKSFDLPQHLAGTEVLLEQRSRSTSRWVVRRLK